ncbi:MAG: toll/interleukin-1 receptor domain-containing protein [Gracilimonas sp.]
MEKFDTFISYAGEDKQFANEIVGALKAKGFKVWYAPIELTVGNKLLDSIEKGMSKSKSGILLISSHYLEKGWTNYEMDTLVRQHIEISKNIYPIWHNVSKEKVEARHSGLGGIVSLKTEIGFSKIISELTKVLSNFAPSVGVLPNYESPKFRFLQGRGEILIGQDGPATTIWEFLVHSKDNEYPLYIDGETFHKRDLLLKAAELLPHIPEVVKNWVQEEGYQKIWEMCEQSGINPHTFQ